MKTMQNFRSGIFFFPIEHAVPAPLLRCPRQRRAPNSARHRSILIVDQGNL